MRLNCSSAVLNFWQTWGSTVVLSFRSLHFQSNVSIFGVCVFCCCSVLFKFTLWTKNNKSILSYTLSLYCEFTNVYTDDKLTNWKRRFILRYSSELVLSIRSWGSACSLSDFSLRLIVLKLFPNLGQIWRLLFLLNCSY